MPATGAMINIRAAFTIVRILIAEPVDGR